MTRIEIKTTSRNQLVDITSKIAENIPGKFDGIVIVYVPHTTAAITINEGADPSVRTDMLYLLSKLVPQSDSYSHMEGNADAHIKAALIGHSVTIIVEKGNMIMGTWQKIFFCEFDGPRTRKIFMKLVAR